MLCVRLHSVDLTLPGGVGGGRDLNHETVCAMFVMPACVHDRAGVSPHVRTETASTVRIPILVDVASQVSPTGASRSIIPTDQIRGQLVALSVSGECCGDEERCSGRPGK